MTLKLEYQIIKEGADPVVPPEYSWEDVVIGITSPEPLIGFKVLMRVVNEELEDPEPPEGPFTIISYPNWTLVEQEITISLPDCGAITYTAELGEYLGGAFAEAGIDEDSGYIYLEVFDLTNFYYLPAFSGENRDAFSGEIEATSGFPQEPYEPEEGIYPMDTVTKFSPDSRTSVLIQYTINTKWALTTGLEINPINVVEDEIIIYQTVNQPNNNWAAQLQALLERCYFTHGIYH